MSLTERPDWLEPEPEQQVVPDGFQERLDALKAEAKARAVELFPPGMYLKKPIPVRCDQWWKNGDHPHDDCVTLLDDGPWLTEGKVVRYFRHPSMPGTTIHKDCGRLYDDHGFIDTLEGGHRVCPGDIIITDVEGVRYPCKPSVFAKSYIASVLADPAP